MVSHQERQRHLPTLVLLVEMGLYRMHRKGDEEKQEKIGSFPRWERCEGHSLLALCGWLQDVLVEIHPDQALALLQLGQVEVHHLIYPVIDGPVKLLRLVAC